MSNQRRTAVWMSFAFAAILSVSFAFAAQAADPLRSWNDGATKQAIIKFVTDTTTKGSASFVPQPERIATFDNDGTLWSEQPMYFQLFFVVDRVKTLAPQHPEWNTKEPFKSLLAGDMKGVLATGEKGIFELVAAASTGITSVEFDDFVRDWVGKARHPKTKRLFTEMVYQPMLELLAYLRANGFKTFIVSGGGIDFMRPWTERVYGIPPEQVVGSQVELRYEFQGSEPVLMKEPKIVLVDDGPGKPVGIQRNIGRRPIFAFGNSDGDKEMLEWTAAGNGRRFAGLVWHTDAVREWAYDRNSKIGHLDKALDEARAKNWTIVNMKTDWKTIWPAEK